MKTEKGKLQFTGKAHECNKIEYSFEFQKNSTYIEVDFDLLNKNEAKYEIGEKTNWPDEPEYDSPEDWTWDGDSSESSSEIPGYEDEGPESSYFSFR